MHPGLFGCLTKLGGKQDELVQKFVPRSRGGIFRNQSTRSTPLGGSGAVLVCFVPLGAFGTIWLPYETRCKTGRTSAKVRAAMSRRSFFYNERTRSTPLDPKLMFWCVPCYLGAFGTVWLPYETQWKIGRTSPKVRATRSSRNYSQRTHPIHPIGP